NHVGHGGEESDRFVVRYAQAPDDGGNPESYSCDATDDTEVNERKEPHARKLERLDESVFPRPRLAIIGLEIGDDELLVCRGEPARVCRPIDQNSKCQ